MCVGCLFSEQELQQSIRTKEKEAKQYGIEHQTHMVLYKTAANEVDFKTFEAARLEGITPIKFVSYL